MTELILSETKAVVVRILAGCVLIHAAEQAYAHMNLIQFPNYESAGRILLPSSVALLALGSTLVLWGLVTELKGRPRECSGTPS